jgi:zinc resistance-associated protein
MKKTMIMITAILAVGFMTASAFAWGHGGGRRGGCGGQGYGAMANLTQEQQTELNTLRQQFVDETYETRSAMMAKHQEVRMLMETSNPDKARLEALSNEILELKKSMADKRIDFALKAKKIAPELNLMAFGRHNGGYGSGYGKGRHGGHGFGNHMGGNSSCPWYDGAQQVTQ